MCGSRVSGPGCKAALHPWKEEYLEMVDVAKDIKCFMDQLIYTILNCIYKITILIIYEHSLISTCNKNVISKDIWLSGGA